MITVQKLKYSYSKKKTLFDGLDLTLNEGTIYGLLGKNGTGKSTLLKLMVGLLNPKEGEVKINETKSFSREPSILNDIFFLSEDYELPNIPIKAFMSVQQSFYSKFDEVKFFEFLKLFEVDADASFQELSFGQKKKALISFGVASNAKYIFLDEPTNGLDIPSKSQFRKVLLSGFKDDQVVVISTHQIRDLNQLIESIVIIDDGKILFENAIINIEDKLLFTNSLSPKTDDNILYSELSTGGYIQIEKNNHQVPSQVELEPLFNALIQKSNPIHQYLKQTNDEI